MKKLVFLGLIFASFAIPMVARDWTFHLGPKLFSKEGEATYVIRFWGKAADKMSYHKFTIKIEDKMIRSVDIPSDKDFKKISSKDITLKYDAGEGTPESEAAQENLIQEIAQGAIIPGGPTGGGTPSKEDMNAIFRTGARIKVKGGEWCISNMSIEAIEGDLAGKKKTSSTIKLIKRCKSHSWTIDLDDNNNFVIKD